MAISNKHKPRFDWWTYSALKTYYNLEERSEMLTLTEYDRVFAYANTYFVLSQHVIVSDLLKALYE